MPGKVGAVKYWVHGTSNISKVRLLYFVGMPVLAFIARATNRIRQLELCVVVTLDEKINQT